MKSLLAVDSGGATGRVEAVCLFSRISLNKARDPPFKNKWLGFPGGSVVKHLPASAGEMVSIPGPGRSHTLRSN